VPKTPESAFYPEECPLNEPGDFELQEPHPLELEDDFLDVFLPDEEQEPLPERGDFWIEQANEIG